MKPATCYPFAIACVLCLVLFASVAGQSQTNALARGSVSGNVKIKGKGAPGIVVGLRKAEASNPFEPSYRARTDEEGNYQIRNVPPGNYDIAPVAPAYVVVGPNNSRSKQVVLGEGENAGDINFSLVRGGVITGKVTDADVRAVIQERVTLYRADIATQQPQQQQRPQLYPSGSVMTDDRGIYRFFGLAAGKYKVAVGTGASDPYMMSIAQGKPTYAQVFHPDVRDYERASVIEVSEASEATNIDITLGRAQQTFAANGQTVDEKGLPMPNVRFGLQRIVGDRPQFVNALTISNGRGYFTVSGLIPGKYQVFLMPESNTELRADSLAFEVIDQDVAGLLVKLSSGASISGVVVVDGENQSTVAMLAQLQINAYVAGPNTVSAMGRSAGATIKPDGNFHLGGLPAGTATMGISGSYDSSQTAGFMIERIERDGVLQPRGIEIRDGEQVTGIRVVLSHGTAVLRGIVNFENGTLPTGSNVGIRLTKVGVSTPNLRPPRLDSRNHFVVEALPAGIYEVTVYVFISNSRTRPTASQQVTVGEGVSTEVAITVDLSGINPQ
jgi:hypothetical protein